MTAAMTRVYLFFFLGLFGIISPSTQNNLVQFEEVTFSSDVEKNLEDHFLNKITDLLCFYGGQKLLAKPSINEAKTRFYDYLTNVETSKFAS
jgi:hypothetical protein